MNATERYPALMDYIAKSNEISTNWCQQMWEDEARARAGAFANVTEELNRAQADYAAQQAAKGHSTFPYNSAMGEFFGLPLKANHEPGHGYYMACCISGHFKLGEATRKAEALIACGKPLRIVAARSKKDGTPIRFHLFSGDQITISGQCVEAKNGKHRVRLSSNWSTESCIVALAFALKTGKPYGYRE